MSANCLFRRAAIYLPPLHLLVVLAAITSPPLRARDGRGTSQTPNQSTVRAAASLYDGIRTETLPNGLRVYLKPISTSPVVTTLVAYKVGSADEDLRHTGLSHYLEHLLFKGTDKLFPGDIDRLTLRNGGANNAYTSEDMTVYHFDFAADRWETALEIEADRMRNVRIDAKHEFDKEKTVVVGELQDNEDRPWDLELKAIRPLLFSDGPYGHPVIGEREHVFGATPEVIKAYYDRWYHPNNAALVVCGGFDPDKALAKIKQLFGAIPAGKLPERRTPPLFKRDGPVKKEIASKFEVPRLVMGFNTVPTDHPDSYALDLVQTILSGGKTGRLYKKLVEDAAVASEAESSSETGRYPGWFAVQVELLLDKGRAPTEELVLAELKKLRDEPVTEEELRRARQLNLAATIFARESVHSLGDSIARGVTTNDLDYLRNYLPRLQAVTAGEVQEAARKYLQPEQRVVVWSVPKPGAKTQASPAGSRRLARARSAEGGAAVAFSLKDSKRVVLPNGLTLLLHEDHRLPIVVAQAHVDRIHLSEPESKAGVARLVGNLLDEGTERHTGPQIAEAIENVGGSMGFSASSGSLKVLTQDRSLGLGLFFECLTRASFPKDAFQRKQAQLLSFIEEANQQPDTRAQILFRETVYGRHPFGRPSMGRRATVRDVTPDDCKAFHRQMFVPNNTVVALVGDIDTAGVIAEVTKLTKEWKRGPVTKIDPPAVDKPAAFTEKVVTMPQAAQLHFYMGHVGIRRDDPDYFKLLVMDYVLGTGPGFTDRLSARLRDREGLGYSVSANITSSAGEQPGTFTCYIGTYPQSFGAAKKGFLEEIHRLRDQIPPPEEVEDAKKYLLGNLPFQFTTNDRVAGQLLTVERYQLGFDYFDRYRRAVAAVTPAEVQAMARKHLDPARMVLVAVGAVDVQGKPLEKVDAPEKKP